MREAAPLQVYLVPDERELTSPAAHPALRLIGIADAEIPGLAPADAAHAHDQLLADAEEAAWAPPTAMRVTGAPSKKKRRGR